MKNIITPLLVVFSIFFGSTLFAQNNLEQLSVFLKNGDIKNLSNHLDEKVEVSIEERDSYTKPEASLMLSSFFSNKTNSEYKAIHKGNTGDSSFYQIGELKSGSEVYRTFFYTKNVNGNYLVQELRIERI